MLEKSGLGGLQSLPLAATFTEKATDNSVIIVSDDKCFMLVTFCLINNERLRYKNANNVQIMRK
ncbi:hypothetical protein CZ797_17200 [Pseudoalteromonas sp. JB197]|nr:hypothetical protein CZ797_17200 [Pseudoalteromonas sp. JB197]